MTRFLLEPDAEELEGWVQLAARWPVLPQRKQHLMVRLPLEILHLLEWKNIEFHTGVFDFLQVFGDEWFMIHEWFMIYYVYIKAFLCISIHLYFNLYYLWLYHRTNLYNIA